MNEARKRRVAEGRHLPTPAAILDNGTATNGHRQTGAAVAALASLPERQRLALFLRYYADLDYTGIAEAHDAAQLLDREAVWAGTSVNGLALESVRELPVPAGDADVPGLSLMYGSPHGPHAEIMEAATLADGLTALVGVYGYEPPEGTALLAGPTALLRSNGLVVAIHASDEQTAIAAARSLQPYSG